MLTGVASIVAIAIGESGLCLSINIVTEILAMLSEV